jgi:hypothetical protein
MYDGLLESFMSLTPRLIANTLLTGEKFSRFTVVLRDVQISQVGISIKGVVVQIFLQRFKSLFFSAETLLGLALGILLGILIPQPYYIGWFVLLGWFLIPIALMSLPFGYNAITDANGPGGYQWPQWAVWARWGVVLYYVLLLVSYGWCSYRSTRKTGTVRDGLLSAVWVALVTIISAIIPDMLTSMWPPQALIIQGSTLSTLLFSLKASVELSAFIAIPLVVLALLAGLVGSWLSRLFSTQADR